MILMNFYINPTAFSAVFTVPCAVADKHLKLAGETQLKVLLFALRNLTSGIDVGKTAAALGLPESETEDAFLYWMQAGLFGSESAPAAVTESQPAAKKAVPKIEKPSRTDVARRGAEDAKIRFLLQEAQQKFGRNLKSNEASTLVWLYDDEGLDVSVILMLIQYAASEGRCNISFIEKTAERWMADGVQNVSQAEEQIAAAVRQKTAWGMVERAFSLEKHRPSPRELELSDRWINEWECSAELLQCAYNACVDSKSKFSMPYTATILDGWHKKGYHTPDDVAAGKRTRKTNEPQNGAAYDLDLFEKMLNSDD